MARACSLLADLLAGAGLILVIIDPTRDLWPVLTLLALAVALWLAGKWLRRSG